MENLMVRGLLGYNVVYKAVIGVYKARLDFGSEAGIWALWQGFELLG